MTHADANDLIRETCRRHGLPVLSWRPDGRGGVIIQIPHGYTGRDPGNAARRAVVRRELRRAGVPQIDLQAGWIPGKDGER